MKRTQRFSIRKSTLGVASVLVGVFAVGVTTATAGTIVPMINGVEQGDKYENIPNNDAAVEEAAKEVIAKYREKNYKLDPTGNRVEGDKLYLNFTKLAANDANYRIVVKVDGVVKSDITHVVNAQEAEKLANDAVELYREDNKYTLVEEKVSDITSEGATLTLNFKTTKRAYTLKVLDVNGNEQKEKEQKAEFPAMTEKAWLEILTNVVATNTTATQVYDESAFRKTDEGDVIVFTEREDYKIIVDIDGVESAYEYKGITHAQFREAVEAIKAENKGLVEDRVGNTVKLSAPKEDYKIVVNVDGVESVNEYKGITHKQFLEALTAVTDANSKLVAGEVKYDGNTVTLNYTTPVVEETKEDYKIVVNVDGVESVNEYKGITHTQFLEALSAVTEANSKLVAGEVKYDGNTVTLNYTTPVVEETKEDYKIVVNVDGVESTYEYKGITHAKFLEALSAVTEANSKLVAGEVKYDGNTVTLNFTTKAVEETKGDYKIVVVIDGVESTYEYKGITHAKFLEALSALTEANKDLVAGAVNYNGNTVTLNFISPTERKDEWVGDDFVGDKENDAKTIVSEDKTSEDKTVEEKEAKLPETGTENIMAQIVLGATALLGSLGLALKKKR